MLSIKKCTCGETTFKLLVDIKVVAACAKCGSLFTDVEILPEVPLQNTAFQLRHA